MAQRNSSLGGRWQGERPTIMSTDAWEQQPGAATRWPITFVSILPQEMGAQLLSATKTYPKQNGEETWRKSFPMFNSVTNKTDFYPQLSHQAVSFTDIKKVPTCFDNTNLVDICLRKISKCQACFTGETTWLINWPDNKTTCLHTNYTAWFCFMVE